MLRVLGRGGMGTVYLCEDLRLPGKTWAIKEMVLPEALPELALERFQREVELLSRLRHDSLPMIADYFHEDGHEYLVMEFVEGETLTDRLEREGPADELSTLRWALEICRVLEYLHGCEPRVIFRDLKPENILVTPEGKLKLIDFGLARHLVPGTRRNTQAWGSVGYSPPEQWEEGSETDERSDLYSLGATLYFCLTARHPSPVYGSNRVSTHRPDVDPDLDHLVARLMEPDRKRRPENAPRVADMVAELLAQRGTDETGQGRSVFLRRRRRRARWLAATLLLGLVALAGTAAWQMRLSASGGSHQDPRLRLAQAAALQGQTERAQAMLDDLLRGRPRDAEAQLLRENLRAQRSGQPVLRVPLILSLTGLDGAEGYPLLYGYVLAQRDINGHGGVAGRPLVFDVFDDGSDSNKALAISRELVANPAYLLVLGPFTSQRALQIAPLFNAHHLTLLAPSASDPRIWQAGPYLMTVADTNDKRIHALARYFVDKGLRRGAVLVDQTLILSNSFSQSFLSAFDAAGGQIVAMVDYQGGETDFRSQVQTVLEHRAQFVFQADYKGSEVLRFARALREAGSTIPIATQLAIHAPGFLEEGGAAVEGVVTASYFHPDASKPEVKAFTESFAAAFPGVQPSHVSAGAYDVAEVGAAALARALQGQGSPTEERERVQAALRSMDVYPGVSGRFIPGRKLDLREAYVIEVRDGHFRLVPPGASQK